MAVVRDARPLLGGSTAIWETLGCVAHTPAPWPRFLSPGNARHALAALDGAAWAKSLWSQA
ncbi:uncharacterized protein TrAtP1_005638 [Trichoderma atroviride]|uniref:uncharacterized protein n=1 Tax=Hypocrea atroviridis TaxID=63577 RepID=UPI00332107B3|nr:hypothetical protein TrAtP1_005638 [Trichoderma atroviride]